MTENKRTLNLPTVTIGFLEVPSPTPYEDAINEQVEKIRRQLTRDQIETISEQAIQRMKEKRIELDWNEA
jgi:hypothetical protein